MVATFESSKAKSDAASKPSRVDVQNKVVDDFDDDSDSDVSIHEEHKAESGNRAPENSVRVKKSLSQPEKSQSPIKVAKSKSSRLSNRIHSALLSDSEEFSRSSFEADEKASQDDFLSPDAKGLASKDSTLSLNTGGDSPHPVVKKKLSFGIDNAAGEIDFVRNQYSSNSTAELKSEVSTDGMSNKVYGGSFDKERIALKTERESLDMQKQKFKQLELDLKLEKDMLDRERTLLEKEKSVFSTDRATLRRERSELDEKREALLRDKENFQCQKEKERVRSRNSSSDPPGKDTQDAGNVLKLELEIENLQHELDGVRREKNAISADLARMEKTLDSEKQLRNASEREANEFSSSSQKAIDDASTKIAVLEVDKKSLESQVEQLKKTVSALKKEKSQSDSEIEALNMKLATSIADKSRLGYDDKNDSSTRILESNLRDAQHSLGQKSEELNVLKSSLSNLEMTIIEEKENFEKSQVKLKFALTENSRLEEELTAVQADKRSIKRQHEDTLDELSRLKREIAASQRREEEHLDEIKRLRPLSERIHELETSLDTEKASCRRTTIDYENALEALSESKKQVVTLRLQLEELQLSTEESKHRVMSNQIQNDEVSQLSDQVQELKSKLLASNSARVDQANQLDESEEKCNSLKNKLNQLQSRNEQLEARLANEKSHHVSSAENANHIDCDAKASRLESKLKEVEVDREAVESRLQSYKRRLNEMQEHVDSLESDLGNHRSKLRSKTSEAEQLKEDNERLKKEVCAGKEKLQDVLEKSEVMEGNMKEMRNSIRRLSDEKDTLVADRESLEREKKRLISSHHAELNALRDDKDRIDRCLKDTLSTMDEKMRAAASANSKHTNNREEELAKANATIDSVKEMLAQEVKKSEEYQTQIGRLSQQLQSKDKELSVVTSFLNQKRDVDGPPESSPQHKTVEAPSYTIEEVKKLKEELHVERKQNNLMQSELADMEFRLRCSEQAAAEFQMLLAEKDLSIETLQSKVKQYQDEILELQQRLHSAEAYVKHGSIAESNPLQSRNNEAEIITANEREGNYQKQARQYQSTIEELHAEKANLLQQLHTLKNNQLTVENQLEETKFELKISEQKFQNSTLRCESLEGEIYKFKNERHQLIAQVTDQSHVVNDLRNQLSNAVSDKESLQSSRQSQSTELLRLREEIRSLQGRLSQAEQRASDYQREVNVMSASNRFQQLPNSNNIATPGGMTHDIGSPVSTAMDEMRIQELRLENERLAVELARSCSDLEASKVNIDSLEKEVSSLRSRLKDSNDALSSLREQYSRKQDEVSRLYEVNSNNNKAIKLLSTENSNISRTAPDSKYDDGGLKRVLDGHEVCCFDKSIVFIASCRSYCVFRRRK